MRIIPNTESQLPKRDQLRIDKELPTCVKSKIASDEPCRETPMRDKDDPKRRIPLRAIVDPTFAQSRSETAAPNRTKLLNDSALPIDTLSRTDKDEPSLTKPITDMPLPTREQDRMDKEEPKWK
jgi:hypothetical protein